MKKALIFSLVCVLSLSFLTFIATADDSKDEKKPYKGALYLGGIFSDADEEDYINTNPNTGGRVAEYGIAESAAILGFKLIYMPETGDYVFADAMVYNEDNAMASFDANWSRVFGASLDYRRFVHRLDNDNLTDWSDSYITFDDETAAAELQMRMQMLNSGVKFTPSSFPGASFFAHMSLIGREGDMQARTLNNHCGNCHMTTQAMAFDTQTLALMVGAEYSQKGFSGRYTFTNRSLSVSSDNLTVDTSGHDWLWNEDGENFNTPILRTPEGSFTSHAGEVRFDHGTQFSVYGKGRFGELENDDTGYTQEQNYWVGRANYYANDWLRFKGSFDYYELTSDVPGMYSGDELINGFGYNRTRFTGTVIYRPTKALKFEGSYGMEDWEREGTHYAEETEVTFIKIKGMYRPNRDFRLSASYKMLDRDNPIGHAVKDHGLELPGIFQASQGKNEDSFKVFALWTPNKQTVLSFNMNYVDETGTEFPNNALNLVPGSDLDRGNLIFGPTTQTDVFITMNQSLDLESTRMNMNFAANYTIDDDNGIYGDFSYFDNNWERESYFGTKSGRPRYYFLDDYRQINWESNATSLTVGGWFTLNNIVLTPSWSYVDAESGYDHGPMETTALDANTVETTINRIQLKASMPLTEKMWISVMYYLDKYEEDFLPDASGEINFIAAWLKWKF